MVLPALVGAYAGARVGLELYKGYQNKKISDYERSYYDSLYRENQRFYSDYLKNTGFSPRYPQRSGAVPNMSALYRAQWNSSSWYFGGLSSGISGAYGVSSSFLYR